MSKANDEKVMKTTTEAVKKAEKGEKLTFGKRLKKWFVDLGAELKKVVWPTKKQVTNNTMIVVVVVLVCAVMLWGFDSIADLGIKTLIDLV